METSSSTLFAVAQSSSGDVIGRSGGVLELLFAFDGRVSRSFFWAVWFANGVIAFVVAIIASSMGVIGALLVLGWLAASAWVGLAASVRRLHDTGQSGALLLLYLIPIIGFLVFLYVGLADGKSGPNRFGAVTYTASDLVAPRTRS